MKKLKGKHHSPFLQSYCSFWVCTASGISLGRRAGLGAEFEEPRWRSFFPRVIWGYIPWQLSYGQSAAPILAGDQSVDFLCFLHLMQRLQELGINLHICSSATFLCPLGEGVLPSHTGNSDWQ